MTVSGINDAYVSGRRLSLDQWKKRFIQAWNELDVDSTRSSGPEVWELANLLYSDQASEDPVAVAQKRWSSDGGPCCDIF